MSYRELRNFAEIMRTLGYPRLISVDNFRNPNFDLVADSLNWLVSKYDSDAHLPTKTDTEEDRVNFLNLAAELMYTKARIKLNTKKLYSADGYSVKELLKIATLLHDSMRGKKKDDGSVRASMEGLGRGAGDDGVSAKLQELKVLRNLATEITGLGATIHDLLSAEVEMRDSRQKVVAKPLNNEEIEQSLKQTIKNAGDNIVSLNSKLENLASDEATLEAKIEKKKTELERLHNRLKNLQAVRPAYMDEYEKLEVELQQNYVVYVEKFRNLSFLEGELEVLNKGEQEKLEDIQRAKKRSQQDADMEDDEFADLKEISKPDDKVKKNIMGSLEGGDESESDQSVSDVESEGGPLSDEEGPEDTGDF